MANYNFTPAVGMGITYSIGGDSYPYTISQVSRSGHEFFARSDQFRGTPGRNDYAVAEKVGTFEERPDAEEKKFTRKKDGGYGPVGSRHGFVSEGRNYRQDPHF